MTDQRAGVEGPQAQTFVVEHAARFGVRGQQHLKATVEQEAVHLVGAQAPARGVASLEHLDVHAVVRELAGAAQPGQSGADDDDVAHAPSPSPAVGSSGFVAPGSEALPVVREPSEVRFAEVPHEEVAHAGQMGGASVSERQSRHGS